MIRFHLGTQSWNFRAWVGPFYPPDTKNTDMLRWYGRMFSSIEVDSSFYGVPAEPILRGWRDKVPDDFEFALKAPQQITHTKRLAAVGDDLLHFTDRVRVLEEALGPILIQLPPDFLPSRETRAVLFGFLDVLPEDIHWAVEFRHPEWLVPETLSALREHNVALALVDGRWVKRSRMLELISEATADFLYLRWMGQDHQLTDYSQPQVDCDEELAAWATALDALPTRIDTVYGYFNNQFQGHSPHSAREMLRLLGQEPVEPISLRTQTELW